MTSKIHGEDADQKLKKGGNKDKGWMLRKVGPEDASYISSAWLHGFRDSNLVWGVPNKIYFEHHHQVLARLIARSVTLVACMEENPSDILGFICYEIRGNKLVFHFCNVRKQFRRNGIARAMWKTVLRVELKDRKLLVYHTHRTEDWVNIYKEHREELQEVKYDPYMMFF